MFLGEKSICGNHSVVYGKDQKVFFKSRAFFQREQQLAVFVIILVKAAAFETFFCHLFALKWEDALRSSRSF